LPRKRSLFRARMALGNTVTTSAPIMTNRDLSRRSMGAGFRCSQITNDNQKDGAEGATPGSSA